MLFIFLVLTAFIGWSQIERDSTSVTNPVDSLQTDLGKKGVVIESVSFVKEEINPLAPSKAAFYSAILPGLGQIYNKRYWKAPLVWGGLGAGIFFYDQRNSEYNRVRDAFKRRRAGFTDDEFPNASDTSLQNAQENLQRERDLWLVVTIGFYALNIIDANVDAHLKQYNVNEQLGYEIKPYMDLNEITGNPNYGLALLITF